MADAATSWLIADARARGISVRQYAKQFGLVLDNERRQIAAHEHNVAEIHDVRPHCRHCAPARHECE